MKALLLIDIQTDFLPGGNLAVPDGDAIIPIANQLQEKFDLLVATQDWHPSQHKSFASQYKGKEAFNIIDLHGLEQVLWPDHCIQGSAGAEFSPRLEMNKVEAIFRKGTEAEIDSYSGFYDNGHRKSTGLADYLKGRKVTQVFLAGLAADFCVFFTAKDAVQEGFETFLIEDATRAISKDGFEKAKHELKEMGVSIIKSTDLK